MHSPKIPHQFLSSKFSRSIHPIWNEAESKSNFHLVEGMVDPYIESYQSVYSELSLFANQVDNGYQTTDNKHQSTLR